MKNIPILLVFFVTILSRVEFISAQETNCNEGDTCYNMAEDGLNIRSTPDAEGQIKGQIPYMGMVDVLKREHTGGKYFVWLEVVYTPEEKAIRGWVAGRFMQRGGSDSVDLSLYSNIRRIGPRLIFYNKQKKVLKEFLNTNASYLMGRRMISYSLERIHTDGVAEVFERGNLDESGAVWQATYLVELASGKTKRYGEFFNMSKQYLDSKGEYRLSWNFSGPMHGIFPYLLYDKRNGIDFETIVTLSGDDDWDAAFNSYRIFSNIKIEFFEVSKPPFVLKLDFKRQKIPYTATIIIYYINGETQINASPPIRVE